MTTAIMIQGTSSDAGKSLITTGLCALLARQLGYSVAPFKVANIALNSGATPTGEEMARAQIEQAKAVGISPEAIMNPILAKHAPGGQRQYVINGKVTSQEEIIRNGGLWRIVTESYDRLIRRFDVIVIEGMGSPVELNYLMQGNNKDNLSYMANVEIAKYAKAPTLLVGDISNGGVWAPLVGTVAMLRHYEPEAARLVKGFIINKGDRKWIEEDALAELTRFTGVPIFGVIPYINGHGIPDEDIVGFNRKPTPKLNAVIDAVVVQYPSLANTDDFEALMAEPGVQVRVISRPEDFGNPDLVVLGGSKLTISDLQWMRTNGLDKLVLEHAGSGRAVIGICGGYQMMGDKIYDPDRVESAQIETQGLGLLPVTTIFERTKVTVPATGRIIGNDGIMSGTNGTEISGYEIHMGRTERQEGNPFANITRRSDSMRLEDGAVARGGLVIGTYIHGVLNNDSLRRQLLENITKRKGVQLPNQQPLIFEPNYGLLADAIRANVDMSLLYKILGR